jgi:adenylate cyclase
MGKEIERKYLVRNDAWRACASGGAAYRQGYLSLDPERSVRVRIAGDRGFLTVKGKSEGASRDEFEYPIPASEAREMLDRLCVPPIIEKTRYLVFVNGMKWEIDEFTGENHGLVVAEVELENENQQVALPSWLGTEVTSDARYYNLSLVRKPFSQWEQGGNK